MKLRINGFENEIEFNQDNVNILEIKDVKCFSHLLEILNEKINGLESKEIFLLDENDKELNMSKDMYIVFDLFNIDYNSKKVLGKLYEIIEGNIGKNQDFVIENMMTKIRNYLITEINELPFEFVMKQDVEIVDILKLFGLKIDSQSYNSILERVEMLIDVISTIGMAKILVIPNLKQYLSNEEILELYKYSLYNNINLLLIERSNNEKLKYESVLCIDNEYDDYVI